MRNPALVWLGVSVWACSVVCAPPGLAEPTEPATEPESMAAHPAPVSQESAVTSQNNPLNEACSQFNAALNVAAANYEDFAYASAGSGNYVDYQDPEVWRTNVVGRTALRQAAAAALSASATPGLPPEVSGPMRSWSLRATKLLLVMGLRAGGDTLNSSATDLNTYAKDAQMACALAARD